MRVRRSGRERQVREFGWVWIELEEGAENRTFEAAARIEDGMEDEDG